MIIFGTRARTKTIGTGRFYCPQCRAERAYEHKSYRPYFTLYFLPIFPVGQGGELIECQTCRMTFAPRVLDLKPPQPRPDLAAMLNSLGEQLAAGKPAEYLIRDLTAQGLALDMAQTMVMAQLGERPNHCPACNLHFAGSVRHCTECGGLLTPVERQ